ncbi:nitrogen fixation negative regulator NifL [Vibrio mangrovi]|uniref:histidine kinase n=1 Tax=Vibrio mangrovi TaxID=474394 RepID=A0A1Y6INM2_9VIBR|nr:nitrogen fixation negative regulator NifL [Vibrio mangrovi]MDW6003959.1 nitrogen fixation negative regulator NifL [Vibrio mangrovi]SMR99247.1 Nitrogen fixation regulatory protein [Vibrio mangrovi]
MGQVDVIADGSIPSMFNAQAFEQIVANAPVAISITDDTGKILFVNQTFIEITGYSLNELIGHNASLLSYKATPQSVYESLWSTITAGKHWQGQLVNRKKNGEAYIAEISISRLDHFQGKTCYYAIHKDISERHQLITHQKNQFAMFQSVLNAAPIAIALIDENDHLLFSNQKFTRIEQSIGQSPVTALLNCLHSDYGHESLNDFMGSHEQRSKSVYIPDQEPIRERWFEYVLVKTPISDATVDTYFLPEDDHYMVIAISERTREKLLVEERRINSVKLMARDNKYVHAMQEALMGTLHQLQGPFNMIESAINILKRTNPSCPGLVAMDEAMASALEAMHDIQLAIPERSSEAFQPVNLNQVIRDVTDISTDELLKSSTKIELHLATRLSTISGMPHRLILAIKQLIDNAIDAIQVAKSTERLILITSEESEEEIRIVVEDSGHGITEKLRFVIFQPFFSTKPKHQSGCRGIGMSIVQQVLNEHSATITIDDGQSLSGARVCLSFPLNQW